MNWRSAEFFIREAMTNIRRNGLMSVAAASTVTISLLIVGATVLAVVNVGSLASTAERMVEIHAYFDKSLSGDATKAVVKKIEILPAVEEVKFISSEEALNELSSQEKWRPETLAALRQRKVLPDSVTVSLRNRKEIDAVATAIRKLPGVTDVVYGREIARNIMRLDRLLKSGCMVLTVLLGLGMLMIIHNTIRLTVFARRREIRIMQLVGATNWFIRIPFLLEGLFYGLVGALITLWLLKTGYVRLVDYLHQAAPFVPVVAYKEIGTSFLCGLIVTGCLFGLSGSLLSLRRYLVEI